jgi:hypothetical protein
MPRGPTGIKSWDAPAVPVRLPPPAKALLIANSRMMMTEINLNILFIFTPCFKLFTFN